MRLTSYVLSVLSLNLLALGASVEGREVSRTKSRVSGSVVVAPVPSGSAACACGDLCRCQKTRSKRTTVTAASSTSCGAKCRTVSKSR